MAVPLFTQLWEVEIACCVIGDKGKAATMMTAPSAARKLGSVNPEITVAVLRSLPSFWFEQEAEGAQASPARAVKGVEICQGSTGSAEMRPLQLT